GFGKDGDDIVAFCYGLRVSNCHVSVIRVLHRRATYYGIVFSLWQHLNDLGRAIGTVAIPVRPLWWFEIVTCMFPGRDGRAAEVGKRQWKVAIAGDHDDENHSGDGKSAKRIQR